MASIIDNPGGRKRIQIVIGDKRPAIRLGKVTMKQAEAFKVKVEALVSAAITGSTDDETSRWLTRLPDMVHDRLSAVGLVGERKNLRLGPWLEKYLDSRKTDLKSESLRKLGQTTAKLLAFFDINTSIRSITPDQAADWRQYLVGLSLSAAAVKTHAGNAKTNFAEAVRRDLLSKNSFESLRSGSTAGANDRHVTPEEAKKIIEVLPTAEWKLFFGFARYAGLRVPSESRLLTWADVDFERGRLNVKSPKTERHRGHERRSVPITPVLMKLPEARFTEAPIGEQRLVTMRGSGCVRATLRVAIERAGVLPWEKLFQTCRTSCEKEWAMSFPQYAVSQWIGHSITVSGKHYTNTVPDELFIKAAHAGLEEAAHKAAQYPAESSRIDKETKKPAEAGVSYKSVTTRILS